MRYNSGFLRITYRADLGFILQSPTVSASNLFQLALIGAEFAPPPLLAVLVSILQTCTNEELEENALSDDDTLFDPEASSIERASSPTGSESDAEGTSAEKRAAIKGKILTVGRMSRVFSLMREESERSSELKTLRIDTQVGAADGDEADYLVDGAELTREQIHGWKEARVSDVRTKRRLSSSSRQILIRFLLCLSGFIRQE